MATKKEWLEYIKALEKYIRDLKKWLKTQKDGDGSAEAAPGTNPPSPPPPPPGN